MQTNVSTANDNRQIYDFERNVALFDSIIGDLGTNLFYFKPTKMVKAS